MSDVHRIWLAWQLWRHMGPGWIARRVWYAAQRKLGWFERTCPSRPWSDWHLSGELSDPALADPPRYAAYRRSSAPRFLFSPTDRTALASLLREFDAAGERDVVAEAERIGRGELCYFSHAWASLGTPPDWHRNPFTGQSAPRDRHWSRLGDFSFGDIKYLWEPARFAATYTLVRAHWRTGDDAFAELFWRLVESWRDANPPFDGVHWKCEQETALRVMAWCFGLYGFLDSSATTDERIAMLARMIAVSGRRIACNLGYPLSQQNNHGMSAGMGLWTIGLLFPEFREATQWRDAGRRILERLARELIYDDGSFAQHSFNYQRLMLHLYLWSIRLGELNGQPLAADVVERVAKSGELLCQVQDDATGRVPNYGANDGALILPLSNCDYQDFRPVVQATRYLTNKERRFGPGAWDEDLLWLFGPEYAKSPVVPPQRTDLAATDGGYYTLRSAAGFAFIRCVEFRHRPAQADQLHVDLWWRGQNVACDAGTYSYNAPPPWDTALADTRFHNTLTVDGRNQMRRAGRFLWLPWADGKAMLRRSRRGRLGIFCGEHYGYNGRVAALSHRRFIVAIDQDSVVVLDSLSGLLTRGKWTCRSHWLLADVPFAMNTANTCMTLATPAGIQKVQWKCTDPDARTTAVRADATAPRGWTSPYYGLRQPAVSLETTFAATNGDYLVTVFSPLDVSIEWQQPTAVATGEWTLRITQCTTGKCLYNAHLVTPDGMPLDALEF